MSGMSGLPWRPPATEATDVTFPSAAWGRTERIVSSSKAANELGIAATLDGATVAIVFEELGALDLLEDLLGFAENCLDLAWNW